MNTLEETTMYTTVLHTLKYIVDYLKKNPPSKRNATGERGLFDPEHVDDYYDIHLAFFENCVKVVERIHNGEIKRVHEDGTALDIIEPLYAWCSKGYPIDKYSIEDLFKWANDPKSPIRNRLIMIHGVYYKKPVQEPKTPKRKKSI
jgi:hypothetical protein